ncbi:MAG: site-specific DNA-methyltransferase, partial [Deltaproteobacteria bacterium]|nr:site-specific DNA-methyltransferase [Deltaproteobacteria bacterium]
TASWTRYRGRGGGAGIEEDEPPAPPAKAISKTGDLWEVGPHRIVCGDSTDAGFASSATEGTAPDIMVTDPPYGVEYEPEWRARAGINKNRRKMGKVANDDRADWYEAWALFKGDVAYVYHAGIRSSEVFHSLTRAGFVVRSQIVWAKDRMALSRGDYHWQHEPAWYAVRKGRPSRRNSDRTQTTLWSIPSREDAGLGHGTQKPVECMARPIRNHGRVGDRVYDPFLGSGTTAVAAHRLDRVFCGIELNPIYVDVSVLRLMRCAPDLPVKCSRPEAVKDMRVRYEQE